MLWKEQEEIMQAKTAARARTLPLPGRHCLVPALCCTSQHFPKAWTISTSADRAGNGMNRAGGGAEPTPPAPPLPPLRGTLA